MAITEVDLQKVRVVLSGKLSLRQAALDYSPRDSVLVCAAIFAAASEPIAFTWKGEYGLILHELAYVPALADYELSDNPDEQPRWYQKKFRLVEAAKRIGLHETVDRAGNEVEVRILPEMRQLLQEDRAYRTRAMGMYLAARQSVQRQREQQLLDRQHCASQRRRFRAAMARSNVFGMSALRGHDLWTLREVHAELGRLLDKYFPEE